MGAAMGIRFGRLTAIAPGERWPSPTPVRVRVVRLGKAHRRRARPGVRVVGHGAQPYTDFKVQSLWYGNAMSQL